MLSAVMVTALISPPLCVRSAVALPAVFWMRMSPPVMLAAAVVELPLKVMLPLVVPSTADTSSETVMAPPAVTVMSPPLVFSPLTLLTSPISRSNVLSFRVLSTLMMPSSAVASMATFLIAVFWLNDSTLMPSSSPESEPLPETDFASSEMKPSAVISALFWMTPFSVSCAVIETLPPVAPAAVAVMVPERSTEPAESTSMLPPSAVTTAEAVTRTPAAPE